jgi:hypothetical protein
MKLFRGTNKCRCKPVVFGWVFAYYCNQDMQKTEPDTTDNFPLFSINRNKAVGIDDVCWKDYVEDLDDNVEWLITRMRRKKYNPIPAR